MRKPRIIFDGSGFGGDPNNPWPIASDEQISAKNIKKFKKLLDKNEIRPSTCIQLKRSFPFIEIGRFWTIK